MKPARFLTDREIYETVILGEIPKAERFVWIATADIKDLYVARGRKMVPFLETLSGLVDRQEGKAVNKVPVIGNFPILGELFKSRDFQNQDTELVIFLSASLMSPESEKNQEMLENMERRYDAVGEKIKLDVFD